MSGGNCPETPRQKMIGMMYLFYTALMALNVSNEVLNAFVAVNAGIQQTTENFSIKTGELYGRIDGKAAEQPGKYAALQKEAHEFEAECNKIFNGIRRIKVQCLNKSDETIDPTNIEMDTAVIKKMDDINAAPAIMDKEAGGVMGDGWITSEIWYSRCQSSEPTRRILTAQLILLAHSTIELQLRLLLQIRLMTVQQFHGN